MEESRKENEVAAEVALELSLAAESVIKLNPADGCSSCEDAPVEMNENPSLDEVDSCAGAVASSVTVIPPNISPMLSRELSGTLGLVSLELELDDKKLKKLILLAKNKM